jgi:hypothetical protein
MVGTKRVDGIEVSFVLILQCDGENESLSFARVINPLWQPSLVINHSAKCNERYPIGMVATRFHPLGQLTSA